jgi:hypothetical protein
MKKASPDRPHPIRATISPLLRVTARDIDRAWFAQPVFIFRAAERIGTNRQRVLAPRCLIHTPAELS